jgi:hypothetical protein
MRPPSIRLGLLIATLLTLLTGACGTDVMPSGGTGGDDDDGPGSGSGTMLPMPDRGFQIVSPSITIPRGKEQTYCYYFKTPNTESLPIKSWQSHMSPGSHHMILYTTKTEEQPAGTVSQADCGGAGVGASAAVWTYSSQTPDQTFNMPGDDGTGVPIAQNIPAGQPAFIQMHYLNSTDNDISAHVELNANAYAEGITVRGAAPYVTYNGEISIAKEMGSKATASGSCTVSPAVKFFTMSTHSHKQGIHTYVKDGDAMVFQADDWEHPGSRSWDAAPFFSFASGKLSYQCDYLNAAGTANPIVDGPSAATNEMCMAIGYFFDPAKQTVASKFCYDSIVLP